MYLFYLVPILISCAGMIFLVFSKVFEIKTGKAGAFAKVSVAADPIFHQHKTTIRTFFSHVTKSNILKVVRFCIFNLFHIFGTIGLFISKHYTHLISRIRGKRFLKGHGPVSFFLKDVAESKSEEKNRN